MRLWLCHFFCNFCRYCLITALFSRMKLLYSDLFRLCSVSALFMRLMIRLSSLEHNGERARSFSMVRSSPAANGCDIIRTDGCDPHRGHSPCDSLSLRNHGMMHA